MRSYRPTASPTNRPIYAQFTNTDDQTFWSTAELFEKALFPHWQMAQSAICALHKQGGREVLDAALAMASDTQPFRRGRAAAILGQIGVPERHFPKECWEALAGLATRDPDPLVLRAAAYNLQFIEDPRSVPILLGLQRHPDAGVRYSVAQALGAFTDGRTDVTAALLTLMEDPDEDVRDWATFGLGSKSEEDSAAIREAFLARVTDLHGPTRQEAMLGLAKRGDHRAIEPLIADLEDGISDAQQEAAAHLLGMDDGSDLDDVEIEDIIVRLKALLQA